MLGYLLKWQLNACALLRYNLYGLVLKFVPMDHLSLG